MCVTVPIEKGALSGGLVVAQCSPGSVYSAGGGGTALHWLRCFVSQFSDISVPKGNSTAKCISADA